MTRISLLMSNGIVYLESYAACRKRRLVQLFPVLANTRYWFLEVELVTMSK